MWAGGDNFTVSYARGRIVEENHYYAFGLLIARISSRKYDGGMEGSLKNDYLYQGDFAELDEDIGWTDFELRNYDGQTGRWIQQDPFQQFASPYIGMGNDPVNSIDPSGGWAATGLFEGMSRAGVMATTTVGGAIIGGAVDLLSGGDGGKGFLIGAGVGLGSNLNFGSILGKAAPSMVISAANIGATALINTQARYVSGGGYQPLYKEFFLNYGRTTRCLTCSGGTLQNKAGLYFQDLFEEYIDENFAFDNFRVVKDPLNNRLPGETRNTVPDYFGIKYSFTDGKKVELTSFYELESFFELKATKNNVGLSSFDGQLKVQIQAAKTLKVREIIIVTTYGVKLTRPLQNFASENGVRLTPYWSQYIMVPNNKMKLNYTPATDE